MLGIPRDGRWRRWPDFARVLRAFVPRQRADNDVEVPVARHFRRRVGLTVSGGFFDEPVHHFKPNFLVRLLSTAKAQLDPHFHVLAQESNGVIEFEGEVVRIDSRGELKLLHPVPGVPA